MRDEKREQKRELTDSLPPVSIYIITYLNSEKRCEMLNNCCTCALKQRYPDFEVVVSDNCGKYDAREVLASISDSRLKIVRNEENLGFIGNINKCVENCSYDIIKPLCDDDLLHSDYLKHAAPLVDDNTLVLTTDKKFDEIDIPDYENDPLYDDISIQKRSAGYGRDLWRLPLGGCPTSTIYSRNLFKELGGHDERSLVSDWDFLVRTCIRKRVFYVKEPLCYIGIWDESLTERINADRPFYFPSAGLYTRIELLKDNELNIWNRVHLIWELCSGFVVQFLRLIKHLNSKVYRSGYLKYLYEWGTCFKKKERTGKTHADPAFES